MKRSKPKPKRRRSAWPPMIFIAPITRSWPKSRPYSRETNGQPEHKSTRVLGRRSSRAQRRASGGVMEFLQPADWIRPKGYSNGVAAEGRTVFVSGMIGWDAKENLVASDLPGQVRQALMNIVAVLCEAKAKPEHIARMTW